MVCLFFLLGALFLFVSLLKVFIYILFYRYMVFVFVTEDVPPVEFMYLVLHTC